MSTHGLANHCLTIRLISAEQTCPDSNRNKQFWRLSCYQLHHRSIGDRRDLNPYTTEPQSAPLSISGTATVRRAGLEPAVSCVSDRRSNRLNYLRCFRKESNLHLLFRKQPFFPLYYGSEILLMRLELSRILITPFPPAPIAKRSMILRAVSPKNLSPPATSSATSARMIAAMEVGLILP